MPWLQISAVIQVVLSAAVITLVLMHSGREAGMGGLGFTPHSQGGTHIVERNLTRLTVVIATLFGVLVLGEHFEPVQLAGIALVCVAAGVTIATQRERPRSPLEATAETIP